MQKIKQLVAFLLVLSPLAVAAPAPTPKPGFEWDEFGKIAVQHRGRMKPMGTYAQETVQFVTGRVKWNGFKPSELIVSWLTSFQNTWDDVAFIKVEYGPLKKELGLSSDTNYFTPKEIRGNTKLAGLVRAAVQKQQKKERQTEVDKKALQVQNQVSILEGVVTGEDINIFPAPGGLSQSWFAISVLEGPHQAQLPYDLSQKNKITKLLRPMLKGYMDGNVAEWNQNVNAFSEFLRTDLGKGGYPARAELEREVNYNNLRPFRLAWIFYTIAFICLGAFVITNTKALKHLGGAAALLGFGMHMYGFILRMLISGRPPVTNMYESIIWVTWGCMLFALLIFAVYKNALIPTAACVFAVVGLVLADNLPFVLDPHIHPLEPVLRSNFWLTIHVLTITLSYAAFALSLCLGNVVLGGYLFKTDQVDSIQHMTLYMYRAVQIGVVLLAAGTILGGVWADYSWGRFWGWDPKEVWALIALLLYVAVLHGRFAGWLKGFGFVVTTVLSFLGVLMAWYGVNFVLGVGLHSYGFGSGGGAYVMGYMAIQLAFIGAAYLKYAKAKRDGKMNVAIFPK